MRAWALPIRLSTMVRRENQLPLAAALLLAAGLLRGWLQPALSRPLRASDLPVALPVALPHVVSFGLLVAVAIVLTIFGLTPWANGRPAWTEAGAVLALASTIGFMLQSWLVDVRLQQRLRQDETYLADLRRLVRYQIPRPHMSTLGPIPLPMPAADVMSGLRSGFYLALAGAVILAASAGVRGGRRRRQAAVEQGVGRPILRVLAAVTIVALTTGLVRGVVARWELQRAEAAAATGEDRSALAHYRTAFRYVNDLASRPDTTAAYGLSLLRTKPDDGPESDLATSRLQLQAGHDLPALQTLAAAIDRWPANRALHEEFTNQAFEYLFRHGAPRSVRNLLSGDADSALLRIALARYELSSGDNPAAIADSRAAEAMSADDEVRSIALTFLSIAQSRSGDVTEGRRTLLAAVDADHDFVNVMARSVLAGLYTTLPL